MNHTLNDLEASERQVAAAIAQVAQQVQVIEEMEREGVSSQTARDLLMIYERTLRDLAEYRDRIALEIRGGIQVLPPYQYLERRAHEARETL